MVFSSIVFLFYFLPLYFAIYFLAPTTSAKNVVTLFFSLVFYAWGEPIFLLVLLASIAFNARVAIVLDRQSGVWRWRWMWFAVVTNLLLLGIFKYLNFIAASLAPLLQLFGIQLSVPEVPLPLGISFFTFHSLSYIIDVYRRRFPANQNPVEVALYIALFPQLVAGPIVRYKTVARQLRQRRFRLSHAAVGCRIFIVGLAQKVLIADHLAGLAAAVFDHSPDPSLVESWLGLLAYTLQIYFDFNGYSNMAVGLGLVIGFSFPRNFRLPYASLSITEFWRRWHISLSSWLRDYLYIPLGGNRNGDRQTYRNLVTVFLLCGLWHGAGWTFVLWGVWHGTLLCIERLWLGRYLSAAPRILSFAYTLMMVMAGWVLFRSSGLDHVFQLFRGLSGMNELGSIRFAVMAELELSVIAVLVIGSVLSTFPRWIALPRWRNVVVETMLTTWSLTLLATALLRIASGTHSPFLYFRF